MTFALATQFHIWILYCWLMPVYNSILINVKAIVAAFNQEMTLVRAFSVIVKLQISQRFVSSSSW